MRPYLGLLFLAGFVAACAPGVNVEQEREALMKVDREWSASVKDVDTFISFVAPDASFYAPGMLKVTGTAAIRDTFSKMASAPGFSLAFAPATAAVAASGDIGYTTGTYQSMANGVTEKGKYVTVWAKQASGDWKVMEDIFNADGGAAPTAHAMVAASSLAWGDPPPSLPPGSKLAVLAGDPSKPGPFVVRVQVPAGYKIMPHWHPGDENLSVLSGTIALGMGDAWDETKMQSVAAGGLAVLPADMRHSFLAKSAATFQVHGMGPLAVNYVNPADDPSRQ